MTTTAFRKNGVEDIAKCFAMSSTPFLRKKGGAQVCGSSALRDVLVEGVEGLHIIGAFIGGGVGYGLLAHATAHLPNGGVFVYLHPLLQVVQNVHDATRAVMQQG